MKLFLDTTVLVDVLLYPDGEHCSRCLAALKKCDHSIQHEYVLKEFLQGPFQTHVLVHNWIHTEGFLGAWERMLSTFAYKPRQKSTAQGALKSAYQAVVDSEARLPAGTQTYRDADHVMSNEIRLYMRGVVLEAWTYRKEVAESHVGTLPCFPHTDLVSDPSTGTLNRKNPFGCSTPKNSSCAVADELRDHVGIVDKLIKGAKKSADQKKESRKRISVLKEIQKEKRTLIKQKDCRDLGDAAIVYLCPEGYQILTRNYSDHDEMASEIGKTVVAP